MGKLLTASLATLSAIKLTSCFCVAFDCCHQLCQGCVANNNDSSGFLTMFMQYLDDVDDTACCMAVDKSWQSANRCLQLLFFTFDAESDKLTFLKALLF